MHRRRAAPDKGGAFLKRRRPLQAAAGMAALAGAGWGRGPEGVSARVGQGVRVPRVASHRLGLGLEAGGRGWEERRLCLARSLSRLH